MIAAHKDVWFSIISMIGITVLIIVVMFFFIGLWTAFGTAIEESDETLAEKLLKRAQEWNILTEINKTLDTAERFEK